MRDEVERRRWRSESEGVITREVRDAYIIFGFGSPGLAEHGSQMMSICNYAIMGFSKPLRALLAPSGVSYFGFKEFVHFFL